MIPQAFITEWRAEAPWADDAQVEQDLLISRVLVEIFSTDELNSTLGFRGGTALNKLHLDVPRRYSEDIDLVQLTPGPIGDIINPLQHRLEGVLGRARVSLRERSARLVYRFDSEIEPVVRLRLKVEIDTRDHEPVLGSVTRRFDLTSGWFTGAAEVLTYPIDEVVGTKLRALYQRSKGCLAISVSLGSGGTLRRGGMQRSRDGASRRRSSARETARRSSPRRLTAVVKDVLNRTCHLTPTELRARIASGVRPRGLQRPTGGTLPCDRIESYNQISAAAPSDGGRGR